MNSSTSKKPKLMVSDLDGTLIAKDKVIRDEIRQAIKGWQDAGNQFVIATGRLITSVRFFAESLDLMEDLICCSGGSIYHHGKLVQEYRVPNELVRKLWDVSKDLGNYCQVYVDHRLIANRHDGIAKHYENFSKQHPRYRIPLEYENDWNPHGEDRHVHKLSFTFHTEEEAERILEALGEMDGVHAFRSLHYLYDIVNQDTDKGVATKWLTQQKDYSEVYVIGDNENDVGMFKHFSKSAAMGQAKDHIKEMASRVVGTDEENGLVDFIDWALED